MAEYRSMEEIRKDEDHSYTVYHQDKSGAYVLEKIIADDRDDARKQVEALPECKEVLLVLKGEILVLWQA